MDKRYTNNDNDDDDDDANVVMSRVSVNTSYSDSSCPGAVLVASSLDMSATTDPANSDSKAISIRVNLTQGGSYSELTYRKLDISGRFLCCCYDI